ncbi:hypothetical protein H0H93_012177, partial [Arthromyces matolae]
RKHAFASFAVEALVRHSQIADSPKNALQRIHAQVEDRDLKIKQADLKIKEHKLAIAQEISFQEKARLLTLHIDPDYTFLYLPPMLLLLALYATYE